MDLGFSYMDGVCEQVAVAAGLPLDQTKYVIRMLLAYPLAFAFSKLPNNPTMKHVISIAIGLWFGWFTMGLQLLHSFVSSTVVYLLLLAFPRDTAHKYCFVWTMGYIMASHIYRMYTDYMGWSMDFTGPQMILTIKLITFAFDYRDGALDAKTMKPYQQQMHLTKLPSILEFYGYVYFFCGFLAGPAFNMKEYLAYIDLSLFNDAGGKIPSGVVPSFIKLGQTGLIAVGVLLQAKYPLIAFRSEEFLAETSFFYKAWYVYVAALLQRFTYYFAWTLSEGSCIMSGIGYSGTKNSTVTWTRANNVKIIGLETSQSFRDCTENWNIRTDKWLKHYIYERVEKNGVGLTFLASAVWHGFYPGYYYSFMTAALVTNVSRDVRRKIRPLFMEADEKTPKPTKKFYDFACMVAAVWMLNYTMTPFILLGFSYGFNTWKSMYFVGHVALLMLYLVTKFFFKAPKRSTTTVDNKAKSH